MLFHTDIVAGDWVDRIVPKFLRPYARLMRLDRPVGTWLLLLPCWWGLALAMRGELSVGPYLLFALGSVVMRGAGCAINDMWDKELDKKVERTRIRPLASGAVSLRSAFLFTGVLFLAGLVILLQFNRATVCLGIASLFLVVFYPLAKRVTWWPQLVLGFVFNWGVLMGWASVRGGLEWNVAPVYVAGIFWTLAYDTIYAHQDKKDDARCGVKSLALRLGRRSRFWIAGFFDCCLLSLALGGWLAGLGAGFYVGLGFAAFHALWQLLTWREEDPASSLAKFKSNRDFGLIVFGALLMGNVS